MVRTKYTARKTTRPKGRPLRPIARRFARKSTLVPPPVELEDGPEVQPMRGRAFLSDSEEEEHPEPNVHNKQGTSQAPLVAPEESEPEKEEPMEEELV